MKFKRNDFVQDDCGCIYKVTAVVKDRRGRLSRLWLRHKDDECSFYMSGRDTTRLKRVK